ncbi:MAG: tetratricopeptide repeat protein, partial [Phycisphaerales bacterium]
VSTVMYVRAQRALDAKTQLENQVETDRSLTLAQQLYAEGRYQAALDTIEASSGDENIEPTTRLLYANLLFEVGRDNDAKNELQKLLSETPEIAGAAHAALANIYLDEDGSRAREHRELAESLVSQTAEVYLLRAMAAGAPEVAVQWLAKALDLDPGHYASRKALVLAYYALKNYEEMEDEADTLIAIRPNDFVSYGLRAIARRESDRNSEAMQDIRRAISLCNIEMSLSSLYDQQRITYLRMGDEEGAFQAARRCAELAPDDFIYGLNYFTALISRRQYDAASRQYTVLVGSDSQKRRQFVDWVQKYAFSLLGEGKSLELPIGLRDKDPFAQIQQALEYRANLETKATPLIAAAYCVASWSPDGKQLAYGRSDVYTWQPTALVQAAPIISRSSGIAILDFESRDVRSLVGFGKDPAWSPDDKYIIFVREPGRFRAYDEEIWIVPAAGGEPKMLAFGGCPSWSGDSKRVFFHSRKTETLCSVDVTYLNAVPVPIIPCPSKFPSVSPNEKYVAYAHYSRFYIRELSSGSVVAEWIAPTPWGGIDVQWSPNGKELYIGGFPNTDELGLWIYDFEKKHAWHIFDYPVTWCSWSVDHSKLAIGVHTPYEEIWITELDPNLTTYQNLSAVLTREEFLQERRKRYEKNVTTIGASSSTGQECLNNLTAIAINQYRAAEYDLAIETLKFADALRREALDNVPCPVQMAFLSMAFRELGHEQEAARFLEEARQQFDLGRCPDESALSEAESLALGQDHPLHNVWEYLRISDLENASRVVAATDFMPDPQNSQSLSCWRSCNRALARAYFRLGKNARHQGRHGEAIAHFEAALSHDPEHVKALTSLARLHAICTLPQLRDGKKALKLSIKACELTKWLDHRCLAALAAAHAENGDFGNASRWQNQAMNVLTEELRPVYEQEMLARLRCYQSKQHRYVERIDGLVGHWDFDNTESEVVSDLSGHGICGTFVGNAKVVEDATRGKVLELNGQGDYVNCGNNSILSLTEEMTLTCWLKVRVLDNFCNNIVTKGNSAWRLTSYVVSYVLSFQATGLMTTSPFHARMGVEGQTIVGDGLWHHVAAIYDGSALYLYVDGILDGHEQATGQIALNNEPVFIGGNSEMPGGEWNGQIDDVHIYSYAMSEDEVKELYAGK